MSGVELDREAAANAPGGQDVPLPDRYRQVRSFSEVIAQPLSAEDCAMQTMPDVSPTRWHLAHTTWFFETFLLKSRSDYPAFDDSFEYLFNSYYNSVGQQFPRPRRGQLSRPGLAETLAYRQHVDQHVERLLEVGELDPEAAVILELGLNHEQQHQELMLTDIKHVLSCNPLFPKYRPLENAAQEPTERELTWESTDEQLVEIGHSGDRFSFDNEMPRHRTFLQTHSIASRCVTNREYLEFINDGGYRRPELWLSLGWAQVQEEDWQAPLYWVKQEERWCEFTLHGLRPIRRSEPVCHVSYFEADAYARWRGQRLPTEFEWEALAARKPIDGVFADRQLSFGLPVHPQCEHDIPADQGASHLFGNLWEWTSSQYSPYPGFEAAVGALGEYNGKFMCNQFVLRGGSCATSSDHVRPTYRNFFPPDARWQFSGIRLAR